MNRHLWLVSKASIPFALLALAVAGGAASRASAQDARALRIEPVAAIRAAAVAFVRSQLPRGANAVEITAGSLDARLRLTHCATALQADAAGAGAAVGRSTVAVSCGGPVRWRIYVPVMLVREEPVLILRHAVARDAVLTPQDVIVQTRRVSGITEAYLSSPAQLSERTVRRTLPAGTALTVDMLTPELIVHRGQDVTLVAQSDGIEVRATGRALESAPAGARIKVANVNSNKIVEGVVESADTVRVE